MPPRQNAATSPLPPNDNDQDRPPRVVNSSTSDELKVLKNRPKASRLRQQKLPAWQPIVTACTAIPLVFAIGVIFIPIGVFVLLAADSVVEVSLDYGVKCRDPVCLLQLDIKKALEGDVYFYYKLDNYFQNHRRYVKSRSDAQLLGDLQSLGPDCSPYAKSHNGKTIAPCGAIANSMFNDTFTLLDSDKKTVPFTYKGVVWEVDKDVKFKNPPIGPGQNLCSVFADTVPPPSWQKKPCELDLNDPDNNGFKNVDFIVWMRTAALPSFKKLYRLLDRSADEKYRKGLPAGTYYLNVTNNYNVDGFGGNKAFIASTTSWVGGHNRFLGIAYIVIGCVCVLLGVAFIVIHLKFGHSFAEMANITPNTQN